MARRQIMVAGQEVSFTEDDRAAPAQGWWAVLRTRVIDEVTQAPPASGLRLSSSTPRCTPRVSADGVCGLVARPGDASTALVNPGALRATIEVEGYLPQVLDAAIDAARRQLPLGAAAGTQLLNISPPETAERTQFHPGRGVMLQRALPGSPEQFALHTAPMVAPALNQVPIDTPVATVRAINALLAGVPIVLSDQRLHRAEPVRIRGRALRQPGPGSAPVAAPAAHIGLRGAWWTQAEVVANSMPPHPARIVGFEAALTFAHPQGAALERIALTPDGLVRQLRSGAPSGALVIEIHPWNGLNPAGGDVLQIEDDNNSERELVISAGFDAGMEAVTPARLRLRTALAQPHAVDAAVAHCATVAAALGTLEREAVAGDRVLFASTLAGLVSADVLRIDGATTLAELRFVRCQPTHDGFVFAHEVNLAADGSFALPPLARVAQVQFFIEHAGHPAQQPFDFVPEPGADNALQVLFTL